MKLKSKKERRRQLFALQGLTPQGFAPQVLKLTPIRAFSVAEAMIALLIGSLILGFSAPMITKQLKHNNFTSIQTQVMNKKIIEMTQKITELEEQVNPAGIVKFFYNTDCPTGWSNIGYEGHYIRVTTNSKDSYSVGSTIGPSLPNITGGFPGVGEIFEGIKPSSYYNEDNDNDSLYGALYRKNTEIYTQYGVSVRNDGDREDYFAFDASKSNAVYGAIKDNTTTALNEENEVLPRAGHLVACRKNQS